MNGKMGNGKPRYETVPDDILGAQWANNIVHKIQIAELYERPEEMGKPRSSTSSFKSNGIRKTPPRRDEEHFHTTTPNGSAIGTHLSSSSRNCPTNLYMYCICYLQTRGARIQNT